MKYLFLLILFMTSNVFATSGIVIVLEAPLLKSPSLNSTVTQTVRRGDKIYLHNKHFHSSAWESTSSASENIVLIEEQTGEAFYQTLSRDGQAAYIQAKYVKVIYKDFREQNDPVTRFKVDPTDYRLEEPLPEDYPLSERDKRKAGVFATMSTHTKSSYPFLGNVTSETYHKAIGIDIIYTGKVSYDLLDRFYFGGRVGFNNYDVESQINNRIDTKQSIGRIYAGPYISYDIYKSQKHRLTSYGSLTLNYNRAYLNYDDRVIEEERLFTAWSFEPEIGALWQWTEVFPSTDIVVGTGLLFQPSVQLKSKSLPQRNFWNEEQDTLNLESGLRANFLIGIQSRY